MNTNTLPETQMLNDGVDLGAPDLRRHPPRSPRVRLGGYVILARCLDKGRATIAGTQGEYHFACPIDRQFLDFVGIEPEALREQLAGGKSDTEILAWVDANARRRPTAEEIDTWNRERERHEPEPEKRAFFEETKAKVAPARTDIVAWFDLMDVDDYASFGGRS